MKGLEQYIITQISIGKCWLSWIVSDSTYNKASTLEALRGLTLSGKVIIEQEVLQLDYLDEPLYTINGKQYKDYKLKLCTTKNI